jgi:hypothetical protein
VLEPKLALPEDALNRAKELDYSQSDHFFQYFGSKAAVIGIVAAGVFATGSYLLRSKLKGH